MAGVLTNDENPAMAPDDLALIAHLLDRRTYFHDTVPFSFLVAFFSIWTPQPQA